MTNYFFQTSEDKCKAQAVTSLPEHEVSQYSNLCFKQWTFWLQMWQKHFKSDSDYGFVILMQ